VAVFRAETGPGGSRLPRAIPALQTQAQMLADAAVHGPYDFDRLRSIRRNVYLGGDDRDRIDVLKEKRQPVFSLAA